MTPVYLGKFPVTSIWLAGHDLNNNEFMDRAMHIVAATASPTVRPWRHYASLYWVGRVLPSLYRFGW